MWHMPATDETSVFSRDHGGTPIAVTRRMGTRTLLFSLFFTLVACSGTSSDVTPAEPAVPDVDAGTDGAIPLGDAGTPDALVGVDAGSDAGDVAKAIVPGPAIVSAKSTCPSAYQTKAPIAGTNASFDVSGQSRTFTMWLPPASFTGPRPLLFAFHGTGGNGAGFATGTGLAEFAAKGFVVIAPQAASNGTIWPVWDALRTPGTESAPNKDLDLFDALVACTAAHFEIDSTRVFVAGHSAGGSFTNKVLRARSSVVAGGLAASGVFSLTGNGTTAPLGDLFVVVTWGGDNDEFNGPAGTPYAIENFTFAEEASLASKYYEAQPAVAQAHCRGNNLGHAWISMNDWLSDAFLTHPKGASKGAIAPFPPVSATCSEAAASIAPLPAIACGASATNGCQKYCQLMADCVGENRTVDGVLGDQLASSGIGPGSCGDCVAKCEASTGSGKATALACFQARSSASCAPGIDGSLPFVDAVNTCCSGRTDASLCVDLCTSLNDAGAAAKLFPTCQQIAP
jgi:poly(3-hydroxybutyrate) depolymerase